MNSKLLIIGHGRHGKDTVCEILHTDHGYNFKSSSKFCSEKFIFNDLKDKYGYDTEEECYNDRHNRRAEWYNAICTYNVPDPGKLGREIFNEYDIYCGLRNAAEFYAMQNDNTFDYVIWVDRSEHLPPESIDSMTLDESMADFVINNNGSLKELDNQVKELVLKIRP